MEYTLVDFQEDDYEFVYEIKKNAYKEYVILNWGKWDEVFQRTHFQKFVESAKNEMFIIIFREQKIGFLNYHIVENGDFEIGNICISKEFQGKGIGTKILSDLIEKHKSKNIHIQYFKQNRVGKLYERLGFKKQEETQTHIKMIKKGW